MIVKLFTLKKGLEIVENVLAIRIKSTDYNLLILKDYISLLGEIHGSLEIETENDVKEFNNIDANFINHDNTFSIIFDGDYND